MKLFDYQKEILEKTKEQNKVAYWLDMGLGKTFIGSEKLIQLNEKINLVVCQKSKINDWYHHFCEFYGVGNIIFNLTNKQEFDQFMNFPDCDQNLIGIINYDLIFRRPELLKLKDFTLLLDESSQIQNEKAKRSKFILNLNSKNNIL
ncbi:MAG: SNF2-related protein [Peptoniphilus grossensis]|uniref:SNF2-related protein n=1 Tax=Peptoniphilus grossensis TaxID=1465756 RepID=UPI002914D72F|nr:SNF2-related protein [Peptoniphilus grossensis]MDU5100729.1 SNF2-related protein [Peptoniphilus grossensis]